MTLYNGILIPGKMVFILKQNPDAIDNGDAFIVSILWYPKPFVWSWKTLECERTLGIFLTILTQL